jgi:predicted GIY-YIG superfamily endonuclease
MASEGVAIYTLSDPRDLRDVRYVGLSRAPARRFAQHVNAARLWLPDDMPWWYKAPPALRPLHDWIRQLHRDEYRLPAMIISAHAATVPEACQQERDLIHHYLSLGAPLLNVESELLGPRIPLI